VKRYLADWDFEHRPPFPAPVEKTRAGCVAVVGGGPAGLACAHRLAMLGHGVAVFEARRKLSGLNEYGVAAYKTPFGFAQREVDFILGVGGIEVHLDHVLGRDVALQALRRDYDAVFLGIGLAGTRALSIPGEELGGVEDAVAYIERLRQAKDLATLPVGRRVVAIGGGNTAIDVAVQARRLGAEDVTILYRRGPEAMSATKHEQEFAQTNGVHIKHWARPLRLIGSAGQVAAAQFEYTRLDVNGRLVGTDQTFSLEADQVFKAIGQVLVPDPLQAGTKQVLEMQDSKIAVDAERHTSLPGVWAGGDCVAGVDLTVQAVQDGKVAAHAIDRWLRAGSR